MGWALTVYLPQNGQQAGPDLPAPDEGFRAGELPSGAGTIAFHTAAPDRALDLQIVPAQKNAA